MKHHGNIAFESLIISLGFILLVGSVIYLAVVFLHVPASPEPTPTLAPREPTSTHQMTTTRQPNNMTGLISSNTPTIPFLPVTWMELVKFIEDDHTNWNQYITGKYVCIDFAIDLVENAHLQKIKAWIVSVMFTIGDSGHAFTAFETTDRGVVFIEPQADVPYINPKVGRPLCDAWNGTMCMGTISSIEYLQCDSDHSHYCGPYIP